MLRRSFSFFTLVCTPQNYYYYYFYYYYCPSRAGYPAIPGVFSEYRGTRTDSVQLHSGTDRGSELLISLAKCTVMVRVVMEPKLFAEFTVHGTCSRMLGFYSDKMIICKDGGSCCGKSHRVGIRRRYCRVIASGLLSPCGGRTGWYL